MDSGLSLVISHFWAHIDQTVQAIQRSGQFEIQSGLFLMMWPSLRRIVPVIHCPIFIFGIIPVYSQYHLNCFFTRVVRAASSHAFANGTIISPSIIRSSLVSLESFHFLTQLSARARQLRFQELDEMLIELIEPTMGVLWVPSSNGCSSIYCSIRYFNARIVLIERTLWLLPASHYLKPWFLLPCYLRLVSLWWWIKTDSVLRSISVRVRWPKRIIAFNELNQCRVEVSGEHGLFEAALLTRSRKAWTK
jgi:hypothetical protein